MIELYELAGADQEMRFSPFCWRVRMALAHKGVPAQLVPWHFGDGGLPGGYTQVPVLVDDGETIADSTAIARHLEAKYHHGPSLFGGDGGEAHSRFTIAWVDRILNPALLPLLAPDILRQVRPSQQEPFRASREARMGMSFAEAQAARPALAARLAATLAPVRDVLAKDAFLGGHEPSYADYAVFGSFQWARCVGREDLLAEQPVIAAWRDRMLDLFDGVAREAKLAA